MKAVQIKKEGAMPIELKYVQELPWKATSNHSVEIDGHSYALDEVKGWRRNWAWSSFNGRRAWLAEGCHYKLMVAMKNFGQEPEHWNQTVRWAKSSCNDALALHSRCLLELRAEIEALKKK